MSAIATDVISDDQIPDAVQADKPKSGFFNAPTGRCGLITYYGGIGRGALAMVAGVAVSVLLNFLFTGGEQASEPPTAFLVVFGLAMFVGIIGFALYFVRLAIRRLHDLNHSAWLLLFFLIPVLGSIFSLYVALVPGKETENRFGAWHSPTRSDKLFAVLGVSIMVFGMGSSAWVALNGAT